VTTITLTRLAFGEVLAGHLAGDSSYDGMHGHARSKLSRGPGIAAGLYLRRRRWHQGDLRLPDEILQVRFHGRPRSRMGL
jgi:hypothetical protein